MTLEKTTKYSPLVRDFEAGYRFYKQRENCKYLAVLFFPYCETLKFVEIDRQTTQQPWAIINKEINALPPHNPAKFILGLDMDLEFDEQFPEHLRKIEFYDALCQAPISWIPDHKGVIPAQYNQAFQRAALSPSLSIVSQTKPSEQARINDDRAAELRKLYPRPTLVIDQP